MKRDFLDPTKYVLHADRLEKNWRTIQVESLEETDICPYCFSPRIINYGLSKPTDSKDVDGRQLLKIHIQTQRYKCNTCGRTFQGPGNPFGRSRMSEEFEDMVAQDILSNSSMSNKEAATKYEISDTSVADALKKYLEKYKKLKIYHAKCSALWFIPFSYKKRNRCIIFGKNSCSDEIEIIEVLDRNTVKSIAEFLRNMREEYPEIDQIVDECNCSPNPNIISAIRAELPQCCITMNDDLIFDWLKQICKDTGDGIWSKKIDATKKLISILERRSNVSYELWDQELQEWKNNLSPKVRAKYEYLLTRINECDLEFCEGYSPEKKCPEIKRLMSMAKSMERKNVPYDIMTLRMLFQSPTIREQVSKLDMGSYLKIPK